MSTTVQVKNSTKHIQLICVTGLFAAMSIVQDFPSDIFSVEVELFRGFKEELWSLL